MDRKSKHDDDDDDRQRILRDGERRRYPMWALDAVQREIAMHNWAAADASVVDVIETRCPATDARWVVDYKVKPLRDALAEELRALYPEFVARLTDLLRRIQQADAEVSRVSYARPGEPGSKLAWPGYAADADACWKIPPARRRHAGDARRAGPPTA
jgi:hypothetical protein